jgi:hypothetical protein
MQARSLATRTGASLIEALDLLHRLARTFPAFTRGAPVKTRFTGLFEDPVVKLREELGIAAVVNGDIDDGDAGLG